MRTIRIAAMGILAGGALGLCACTTPGATIDPSISETTDASAVVTIPFPDIGEFPAAEDLADEEIEGLRLAEIDSLWESVAHAYPGAVRPNVAVESFVSEQDVVTLRTGCFADAGVPVENGIDGDGRILSVGAGFGTEAAALAEYTCQTRLPLRPYVPPTDEQVSYIYDYLTQFVLPCYAANGIQNADPPAKAQFVADWPDQGWYPDDKAEMGSEREAALIKACTADI